MNRVTANLIVFVNIFAIIKPNQPIFIFNRLVDKHLFFHFDLSRGTKSVQDKVLFGKIIQTYHFVVFLVYGKGTKAKSPVASNDSVLAQLRSGELCPSRFYIPSMTSDHVGIVMSCDWLATPRASRPRKECGQHVGCLDMHVLS